MRRALLIALISCASAFPALAQDGTRIIIRRPLTGMTVNQPSAGPSTPSLPDAVCGSAQGSSSSSAPISNLCLVGSGSSVSQLGNVFGWSCVSGASTVSCSATKVIKIDGVCGSSNAANLSAVPTTGLCETGDPIGMQTGASSYSWKCQGISGGGQASCYANRIVPVNGVCGPADGSSLTDPPASSAQCSGGVASEVTTSASSYSWSCAGANGGGSPNCSATRLVAVDGVCGSSNGSVVADKPMTGLCSTGISSSVSGGASSYNWSCSGENGGGSSLCSAAKGNFNGNTCTGGTAIGFRSSSRTSYSDTPVPLSSGQNFGPQSQGACAASGGNCWDSSEVTECVNRGYEVECGQTTEDVCYAGAELSKTGRNGGSFGSNGAGSSYSGTAVHKENGWTYRCTGGRPC